VINVAVLGSNGMLGSTMTRVLENSTVKVYEFNRSGISITQKNDARKFDIVENSNLLEIFSDLKLDYIVNCIGMIKQLIKSNDDLSLNLAYKINTEFPEILAEYAKKLDIPVIQIGTDCVYSGHTGLYSENYSHDPSDIYGETKSKGELASSSFMLIRSSIIGNELTSSNSLLSWVLSHPHNSSINGYTNHYWNGVTTLHFSQIVSGIIRLGTFKPGVSHLVPQDIVSKYDLIRMIARAFGRNDLRISKFEAEIAINRSLTTINPSQNQSLWQDGGYIRIPTIEEMVSTYGVWIKAN